MLGEREERCSPNLTASPVLVQSVPPGRECWLKHSHTATHLCTHVHLHKHIGKHTHLHTSLGCVVTGNYGHIADYRQNTNNKYMIDEGTLLETLCV